jgi:uncharacterized protein (TIGR03118 family)
MGSRFRTLSRAAHRASCKQSTFRPTVESLEERSLLSANVLQTNLVSDLPGVAAVTDPNLVNPWGVSESSASPFWIADNNAGVATLYRVPGANNTPVSINPLVVSMPTPGDPAGNSGAPTGTVFNIALAGGAFQITDGTHTAPAVFLFDTEDGTILGWNPGVDPTGTFNGPNGASTHAVIPVDNSGNNFTEPDPNKQTGAVYKGLAIASGIGPIFASDANSTTVLYAANFRAGTVEVYDTHFAQITSLPAGAFNDPNLPKGYAPFDVQVLNAKLYVTYAKQNADKHDDLAGPHRGFVDVFNLDGSAGLAGGKVRLISRGPLDSPWGLAIAPGSFGSLGGALLVGNFGNGHINAFNATTGAFLGELKDPDGEPIQIDGLWTIRVGNNGAGGDANTVYFTAGIFDETHGLFGSLTPVAAGTPEGPAEAQRVQGFLDVFQINLNTLLADISAGASRATIRQDIRALNKSLTGLVQAEVSFARDTRADLGTHGHAAADEVEDALDAFFSQHVGGLLHDLS